MSLTYKEIHETYDSLGRVGDVIAGAENAFSALMECATDIVYVGCGSSYSIAKSLARTTRMHLKRPAYAVAGGDLLVHAKEYVESLKGALVVCVSRSGSTSELILAFKALKDLGCAFKLVSLACSAGSALAAMSDLAVEMPWAFDESVCQTRTVTCMYYALTLLIARLSGNTALAESLGAAVERGPAFLDKAEPLAKSVARENWTRAVVLADAQISGIAEEGSLVYKEICQLPSNFYNVLDSRHGPMVLFDEATLAVIAVSSPMSAYESALVADVVQKGCNTVVYSDLPMDIPGARNIAFGETLSHAARGVPFILLNQLLAYYKSESTGANPDKPDGLDPWIKL